MASRKVKRNTSKQIISYTLDPEGTDSYGTVKIPASKTDYIRAGFNKVLYTIPTELVNQTPTTELTIISEERLDLNEFTGFKDTFSARYELPQTKKKYYVYNQSFESNNEKPYGSGNLGFSKVVFGPPQTSPGRYTITKELIDSGNDLKLSYQIRSFDKRESQSPTNLSVAQATAYLNRYVDLRNFYGKELKSPMKYNDYTTMELTKANLHWLQYGKKEKRLILHPVGIDTRFQRIRKSVGEAIATFAVQNTVTDFRQVGNTKRPPQSNGFNHAKSHIIKNEDMQEFDEWEIVGSCGTADNSEVGYYVDSSWWDIQLISN